MHGGDGHDARREHAGRVAGLHRARRLGDGEQAPEARGLARQDRHRHPGGAHRAAVHPGDAELHAGVVEEVTGLEVVRAVDHDVGARDERLDVVGGDVGHHGLDLHAGVDPADRARGGDRLGCAGRGVGLVVQQLALQVAQLHEVTVDDQEVTNAGARQQVDHGRPEGPAADDEDAARPEARLSFGADSPEALLARVPVPCRGGATCHVLSSPSIWRPAASARVRLVARSDPFRTRAAGPDSAVRPLPRGPPAGGIAPPRCCQRSTLPGG